MFRITMIEFYYDLKKIFRRGNLIVLFLLIGLIAMISATEEGEEPAIVLMSFSSIWTCLIMKPKINKLHFLLPSEAKSRVSYILIKCFGIFLFNIVWYLIAIGIIMYVGDYKLSSALQYIVCKALPFLIIYISISLSMGYNLKMLGDIDWREKNQFIFVYYIIITFTVQAGQNAMLSMREMGVRYILITIAYYLLAFTIFCFQIRSLKQNDTNYENVRKTEKLFS